MLIKSQNHYTPQKKFKFIKFLLHNKDKILSLIITFTICMHEKLNLTNCSIQNVNC